MLLTVILWLLKFVRGLIVSSTRGRANASSIVGVAQMTDFLLF